MLGGKSYWPYGVERLLECANEHGLLIAFLPGGNDVDPTFTGLSTLPLVDCENLRNYLAQGGPKNALNFWNYCVHIVASTPMPERAQAFPRAGVYRHAARQKNKIGIVFYRSIIEGGQTAPIDLLCDELQSRGHEVSALYVAGLKDLESAQFIKSTWQNAPPDVIINATAFAVGAPEHDPLSAFDCPVLQVAMSGSTYENWQESSRGIGAKDLAMSVVLPEIDGRIFTRAISFKADTQWHNRTQCKIIGYVPVVDRIRFVAEQAEGWARLRHKPNGQKHIAIILANYPNKDGRLANGVGYDTPASTINILKTLAAEGYKTGDVPANGNSLMTRLQAGVTNARSARRSEVTLGLADYHRFYLTLPAEVQQAITSQWGRPETDPFIREQSFHLPLLKFGNIVVGIQPARGYNIDPKTTYHDPSLVPPHGYLAFYCWLRNQFNADAIIHNGKHGNLEWLPGKSVGLSAACYPEAILGPVPHIYPFIVNDPGEGTAAKRRASAVIIDHLTPPLTRAESYGPMKDLEALVDEYYLAAGLDNRRLAILKSQILELTRHHKLDKDAGFTGDDDNDLQRLDTFLCDLKEAQIRDGLHILGESPTGQQETDLLVALTRIPRGRGEASDQSIIRALSNGLGLAPFDPLNCEFAQKWQGAKPKELQAISDEPWRSNGDTVERLELLAQRLVAALLREQKSRHAKSSLVESLDSRFRGNDRAISDVLENLQSNIRPLLQSSGPNETANLMQSLKAKAVPPGPSGAPTRGRLDVLPTGRNFYSIDNRSLPTPTAWTLGKASADALLIRHFQDTGQHLTIVGLSVWGTANMRTGGDDLAQALWLMGVKPQWDSASWRVTGFEVLPPAALGRPRVDVTLRISGLFRDAFPTQIELLDKAIRVVAALEESAQDNPLAAKVASEAHLLVSAGLDPAMAADRIFGAKPGAYGAGLQALMDEGLWDNKADIAAAYVTWGAYVYGAHVEGRNDAATFHQRLASIQAVIHNQDNREHDLLDSDDYYQFEGGMSAAVETASGTKPVVYHNDHSRPERPVIRTLDEEISRVMRSRVVNPKWINGVKRHGYKGAFEIAATVDYMFAFAATADAVKSHHFDLAYDAYIADDATRKFMLENNPAALKEMAMRFNEAMTRGLWQPRLNSTHEMLKELIQCPT